MLINFVIIRAFHCALSWPGGNNSRLQFRLSAAVAARLKEMFDDDELPTNLLVARP